MTPCERTARRSRMVPPSTAGKPAAVSAAALHEAPALWARRCWLASVHIAPCCSTLDRAELSGQPVSVLVHELSRSTIGRSAHRPCIWTQYMPGGGAVFSSCRSVGAGSSLASVPVNTRGAPRKGTHLRVVPTTLSELLELCSAWISYG
eukprot:scaffold119996_cov63-Phaeocystis_antarctica.AAC.2